MHHPHCQLRRSTLSLVLMTLLAGCGAGGAGPSATPEASVYAETMFYCGSQEPTGASTQHGGLNVTSTMRSSAPFYDVSAMVSPAGAASPTIPVRLQVDTHNYSAVTGSFHMPGYGDPQSKMGVNFASVLPARSAACVAGLAKLTSAPVAPGAADVGRYFLSWRSKWSNSVSLAGLPGRVIDGFELVADFTPVDATVFFFLLKSRTASTQGLSICYLAPAASSWDCAAATATDAGNNWGAARAGAAAGVYVITTPSIG
ncbi:MAG: hypothetical protein JWP59_4039 [Massilia sp.]|nr:hypothetical protein [Massilia sp.]